MPETPPGAREALEARLASELGAPLPEAVTTLAQRIRERHGSAVASVLFYGSCLRRGSSEGVLDFYVVVDGYRAAHGSRTAALFNAILPPNVYYCEVANAGETLRAKYALLSARDLRRRASPASLDARVWARFCQPVALAYARDDAARRDAVEVALHSCLTFVDRMRFWVPGGEDGFRAEALWRAGFRETYRAELRSESAETVRALHDGDAGRYDFVARQALRVLAARGRLVLREEGERLQVASSAADGARGRLAWRWRRPVTKLLAVLGLLKTAVTFGDWVPYVLWKLERHTSVRIQVSERQRRHPLLFGWPVIFRVLREGLLR